MMQWQRIRKFLYHPHLSPTEAWVIRQVTNLVLWTVRSLYSAYNRKRFRSWDCSRCQVSMVHFCNKQFFPRSRNAILSHFGVFFFFSRTLVRVDFPGQEIRREVPSVSGVYVRNVPSHRFSDWTFNNLILTDAGIKGLLRWWLLADLSAVYTENLSCLAVHLSYRDFNLE